jgi:hypothetical protein
MHPARWTKATTRALGILMLLGGVDTNLIVALRALLMRQSVTPECGHHELTPIMGSG